MQKFQAGLHQIQCIFIKATLSVRHPKKWSSPNYTKCPSTPIGFPCCGQNEDYMNDWLLMILSLALIDFGSLGHFKSLIMLRFVAKPVWHVRKLPQMKRSGSFGHCKYIWATHRSTVTFTRQYTSNLPHSFDPTAGKLWALPSQNFCPEQPSPMLMATAKCHEPWVPTRTCKILPSRFKM